MPHPRPVAVQRLDCSPIPQSGIARPVNSMPSPKNPKRHVFHLSIRINPTPDTRFITLHLCRQENRVPGHLDRLLVRNLQFIFMDCGDSAIRLESRRPHFDSSAGTTYLALNSSSGKSKSTGRTYPQNHHHDFWNGEHVVCNSIRPHFKHPRLPVTMRLRPPTEIASFVQRCQRKRHNKDGGTSGVL